MKGRKITDLKNTFETNKENYYNHAVKFWNDLSSHSTIYSANQWMNEYDAVFKFITDKMIDENKYPQFSNSQVVYDVYKRILEEKVVNFDNQKDYLSKAQLFIRTSAYIHRFFIPNQNLKDLFLVATEISDNYFK